ncbi:MAG: radical SAM protein [Thermodesulfovibrionales bacterium]|nr:radical SAM protein [Thermodesulfovibrionales bacterium]
MRILLVNPFGSNWIEGLKGSAETSVRMAPIGILSIAAYLAEKGVEVKVADCRMPAARANEAIKKMLSFKPDMAGFTATTSGFIDAYRIAEALKNADPGIRIIFGGVHVSALRGSILENFPCIDYVINGEGEKAMAELAAGASLDSIQGLVYRNGSGIKDNGVRTDLCDLDSLPFPAYNMLEGFPKTFQPPLFNYPRFPSATMISSRGCPYQCSYCDRSVFRKSFRYNSADYLYEQMAFLRKEFNIRHIFFYDDLFTFHRKRIEEFCGLMRKKPLLMTFNCAVRVGHIDDDLLRMLKAAGCWMVSIGMESGDPGLLARHKSNMNLEEVKSAVRSIQRCGIRVKGLFMMGLPGETEQSIRKTADFIETLELDDVNMTKFTPFPGSPIYKTVREEGEFKEDWELMNCLNFVFVPHGIASGERLDELYRQSLKKFYTSKNWLRKFGPLMFKSPHSTFRMLRNLPTFLRVKNEFAPRNK